VRADIAIRRHWQLVCCAFSFCWYHQRHAAGETVQLVDGTEAPVHCSSPTTDEVAGRKKISASPVCRPRVSWPVALRQVRSWLEPWIMLWRYWRAWSTQPPPLVLQQLLDWLWQGRGIYLYESS